MARGMHEFADGLGTKQPGEAQTLHCTAINAVSFGQETSELGDHVLPERHGK